MHLTFRSIREDTPGDRWRILFEEYWESYERWFLSQGHQARPGYVTCMRSLRESMPELLPVYEQLTELAGGGDVAARFLSLYQPPPFLAGCSQAIWTRDETVLIRNYDYHPDYFEGVLLYSNWLRPVIAMSDCLWGVLDGINDAGLVASLAFGGRKITGDGFGVPLLLRYILETCDDTPAAIEILKRVPIHMAYNVTVLDRNGSNVTAYLSPTRAPIIEEAAVVTNHQERVEWEDYARLTATVERKQLLEDLLADDTQRLPGFIKRFLAPPLYQTHWERGFGTLYTAAYYPADRALSLMWDKHHPIRQTFDHFTEGTTTVSFKSVPSYVK